jgi:hypothetical protein
MLQIIRRKLKNKTMTKTKTKEAAQARLASTQVRINLPTLPPITHILPLQHIPVSPIA